MGHCHVCGESVESVSLLDHIRVMHPDEYGDGPERWPDGGVVLIDTEPTVEDLRGETA